MDRRSFIHAAAASAVAINIPARAATPDLAGDVAIVREAVLSLHPGLYRYLSPRGAEAEMQRFARALLAAPDIAGQYLALSRFTAAVRCGHTQANVYNQKKKVLAALFDRPTLLPFGFRWIGNRMIVTADHGDGVSLRRGDEVLAINGLSAARMLARLMPYARADGHNDDKRRMLLSVTGSDEIETFDAFHALVYGVPEGGTHRLSIRRADGAKQTLSLPAISPARRREFRIDPARDGKLGWRWEMRNGVGVMTMPTWVTYRGEWDWRGWIKDRLDSLKSARGLIVDLRDNEGGTPCGDEILARFLATDLPAPERLRLTRYRTTPKTLDPYLDTWDDSFRTLGAKAERHDDRFFRLPDEGDDGIKARSPRIVLPLVVLTGPQNSSATFLFAQNCRRAGVGTLIGEPTGGNRRGINGGAYFFVRLPASNLEFDVPLIGYFPTAPMPDAGLIPDIAAPQTARDIATGRDAAMEAAIARIG